MPETGGSPASTFPPSLPRRITLSEAEERTQTGRSPVYGTFPDGSQIKEVVDRDLNVVVLMRVFVDGSMRPLD